MSTLVQGIEVKLSINPSTALNQLKQVEQKLSGMFSGAGAQGLAKNFEQQSSVIVGVVNKINVAINKIDFDKIKSGFAGVASAMKASLAPAQAQANAVGNEWIKMGDAAKRYGVSEAMYYKAIARSGEQKPLKSSNIPSFFESPLASMKYKMFGRVPPVGVMPGQEEMAIGKDTYISKADAAARAIHSGKVNAGLLVAAIDRVGVSFNQLLKPVNTFVAKLVEASKIQLVKGVETAEAKAKQHEGTLRRIFNFYMRIYTAPFRVAGSLFKKSDASTAGMASESNALDQTNKKLVTMQRESAKATQQASLLRRALVFTVTLPTKPFTMAFDVASWAFNKIKQIGLGVFAAIAAAGFKMKEAMTTFLSFDKEMAMVNTLLGYTKDKLDDLKKKTREIALATGADIAETAKGLYWTISGGVNEVVGYTEKNMLNITKQVSEIAAATGASATDSTRAIMGVVNTYGNELGPTIEEQAKRVSDVIFKTTFLGITSVQELAGELGFVIPIWKQMELPIEELGAALAVLTRGGMHTSNAITALKSTIAEVMKPSEQATNLARKLGIDFSIAGLKAKGYAAFMTDIMEKTQGMPEHLVVLFNNIRSLSEVLGKAGNNKVFLQYLQEMEKAAGSTDQAIGKIRESDAFKEKQLDVRFQVRKEKLGGIVVPVWSEVKKAYLDIMDAVSALIQSYWSKFKGDKTASDAFKAQFDEMLNAMPSGLQAIVRALSAVIAWFAKAAPATVGYFEKVWGSISNLINKLDSLGGGGMFAKLIDFVPWEMFVDKIGTAFATVIDFIGDTIVAISEMLSKTGEAEDGWSILGEMWDAMKGLFAEIFVLFSRVWDVVVSVVKELWRWEKKWGAITYLIKGVAILILAPLYAIVKIVAWTLKLVNWWLKFEAQMKGFTTLFALLGEGLSMIVWAIMHPMEMLNAAWETFIGLIYAAWDGITWLFKKMYEFASKFNFSNPVTFVKSLAEGVGKLIWSGDIDKEQEKITKKVQVNVQKKHEETTKKVQEQQDKQVNAVKDAQDKIQKKIADTNKKVNKDTDDNLQDLFTKNFKIDTGLGGAAIPPSSNGKTSEIFDPGKVVENQKAINEKIIAETEKTAQKNIDVKQKESAALREIQYKKEQAEITSLDRMKDYIEHDFKRRTDIIKKNLDQQQKIVEKAKEKEADFLKRKGEAEIDFEEKKARIISAPLGNEGKDIQQRGLANLYKNQLSQALGQGNFQEAHALAKKVQDIYASLAEKQDNAMRNDDFQKFIESQEKVMSVFEQEKKASDDAVNSATKKITDLKSELRTIFTEFQKDLSISVSTSEAEDRLAELRKKFVEMRKDFAEFLPGGNEFQYERNPEISLFRSDKSEMKKDQKDKSAEKMVEGQKQSNETLKDILGELKNNHAKDDQAKRQRGFAQDNKGQFVVNEVK